MKALRIHGREDIRFEEVPDPLPGPGEVLARVRAVGLCRTDIEVYEQRLYHYSVGVARLPVTPGHEWAGVVAALGEGVSGLAVGDPITCETALGCGNCQLCLAGHGNICQERIEVGIINYDGAMAEYVVAPRRTTHLIGDLSYEAGAMVEPTAVAVYAVRTARVTPADRVLVLGAGPIGQLLAQVARAYGAQQVAIAARTESKLALARSLGADASINTRQEDLAAASRELTSGHGFDVVLEAAGAPELLQQCLLAAAVRGRIVVTGSFVGALASVDPDLVVCKELTIAGTVGGEACYNEAIALLCAGRVRCEPLVSARYPLSEAPAVFAAMTRGAGDTIKILFDPAG